MTSIQELTNKLPPLMMVGIECTARNRMIVTLQHMISNLQLAHYWWREANTELHKDTPSVDIDTGEHQPTRIVTPTLIGTTQELDYLLEGIRSLSRETEDYINTAELPTTVRYKVKQGYNRVMEALFNTELSTGYYEQITGGRRPK